MPASSIYGYYFLSPPPVITTLPVTLQAATGLGWGRTRREQPTDGPGPRRVGERCLLGVRGTRAASEARTRVHMLGAEGRDLSAHRPRAGLAAAARSDDSEPREQS
eukprot:scaffold93420_cov59-Phaeocystis_antarctica.AAC.10